MYHPDTAQVETFWQSMPIFHHTCSDLSMDENRKRVLSHPIHNRSNRKALRFRVTAYAVSAKYFS
jgi:hypothetical protein